MFENIVVMIVCLIGSAGIGAAIGGPIGAIVGVVIGFILGCISNHFASDCGI